MRHAPGPARGIGTEPAPKVRVLHVVEAFGGGILEMIRFLSNGAAEQGHDMAIAYGIRPETPGDVRALFDPRVELFALDWRREDPRTHLSARARIRRLVDSWAPDVVHLHSSFAGAIGSAALGRRIPTVFTPNAYASQVVGRSARSRRAYEVIERFVSRRSTLVGAVSQSEARQARRYGAERVEVVPNGIPELDPTHIDDAGPPVKAHPPRVVALGRLGEQRQPLACARILGAVSHLGAAEWLGGGGSSTDYADAARAELEARGIGVSGWLPREELKRRLGEATVYLHWTTWDGLAFSVLEAMALDVVVIASSNEPNRELLPDGQCVDTEAEAVSLLQRVLSDPELAESMRALQRALRGAYSAQRMTDTWLEHYRALAAARPTRPAGDVAVTA